MSTSTIAREERKPFLEAYLFERRTLLGCIVLVSTALICWIVAISSDHWYIISTPEGIYIQETRKYFLSSHSGLWKICRYSTTPHPINITNWTRNFTALAYQNASRVSLERLKFTNKDIAKINLDSEVTTINPGFRYKLFVSWIKNETVIFQKLKKTYKNYIQSENMFNLNQNKPILVNPTNLSNVKEHFGDTVSLLAYNNTQYNIVVPRTLRYALFNNWEIYQDIIPLLWAYGKDLEIPIWSTNSEGTMLLLRPPKPPKKGKISNGYEYIPFKRCKYIDMFPTEQTISADPSIDDEILDYLRTQASFACITVFIMVMGLVFSIYTFINPRYMFKRLAGGIHFIAASTTMVVIQVLVASLDYRKTNMAFSYPEGAQDTYGYGVYLSYFVFLSNLFSAIMFVWYSRKKKGRKAPTEDMAMVDEPTIIGR